MMQSPMADKRQLVDGDRLHVAIYRANTGSPRWHGSRNWGGARRGISRKGVGGQLRLFGRTLEVIVYKPSR